MPFRNSSRTTFNTQNFLLISEEYISNKISGGGGQLLYVVLGPVIDNEKSPTLCWELMLATLLQDSEVTVVIKYAKPSLIIITRWILRSLTEYKLSQEPNLREAKERLLEKYGEATRLSDEVRCFQAELVIVPKGKGKGSVQKGFLSNLFCPLPWPRCVTISTSLQVGWQYSDLDQWSRGPSIESHEPARPWWLDLVNG